MRLVAIAVVRNEADIIEPFVRHTLALVDRLLVVDHASTDGTRQLLRALVNEGLALDVFTDEVLANLQQQRCRLLLDRARLDHAADWILPVDADEFLVAPDRRALDAALHATPHPIALPLRHYCASLGDDPAETNPVRRIQHRSPVAATAKLCLPAALFDDTRIVVGKGSHAVFRDGIALAPHPAAQLELAHFPLRSPAQQAIRIVTGELQKLSRGQEWLGLDEHYRPGFELLRDSPAAFAANLAAPVDALIHDPLRYLGGPLRYTRAGDEPARAVRALLPFLEQLAVSHGRLLDATPPEQRPPASDTPSLRPLDPSADLPAAADLAPAFTGFSAITGWGAEEGPIPESFLPRFHWAMAPETVLQCTLPADTTGLLDFETLTYSEAQCMEIEYNGVPLAHIDFPRPYHRLYRRIPLPAGPAPGRLVLRFNVGLCTAQDPRRLAAIFLRLTITRS